MQQMVISLLLWLILPTLAVAGPSDTVAISIPLAFTATGLVICIIILIYCCVKQRKVKKKASAEKKKATQGQKTAIAKPQQQKPLKTQPEEKKDTSDAEKDNSMLEEGTQEEEKNNSAVEQSQKGAKNGEGNSSRPKVDDQEAQMAAERERILGLGKAKPKQEVSGGPSVPKKPVVEYWNECSAKMFKEIQRKVRPETVDKVNEAPFGYSLDEKAQNISVQLKTFPASQETQAAEKEAQEGEAAAAVGKTQSTVSQPQSKIKSQKSVKRDKSTKGKSVIQKTALSKSAAPSAVQKTT